LLEGLAVHPKLFRGPLVDSDRRLAQGYSVVLVAEAMVEIFYDADAHWHLSHCHLHSLNSRFMNKLLVHGEKFTKIRKKKNKKI
jgi:hypothetical protein